MAEIYTDPVGYNGSKRIGSEGGYQVQYDSAVDVLVSGGTLGVYSGGTALNTRVVGASVNNIYSSGVVSVKGGITFNTVLESGGIESVQGNGVTSGVASGTLVSSGGSQIIGPSGKTVGTHVSSGGSQVVNGDGVASGTHVSSYGYQSVNGGVAVDTHVSGGSQVVKSNGVASGTLVSEGGGQIVYSGGLAIGTVIFGGSSYPYGYYGGQQISSGGTAQGTVVKSGGALMLAHGGTATGIRDDGGNVLTRLVISSGGFLYAINGGTAEDVDLKVGGIIKVTVTKDTTDQITKVAGSNAAGGTFDLTDGLASGFILYDQGSMTVNNDGVAEDITVSSGGKLIMSNGRGYTQGKATGVTLASGGIIVAYVQSGDATVLQGTNAAGNTAFGIADGTARNIILYSGGVLDVVRGTAYGTTVASGGDLRIISGAAYGVTQHSGGRIHLDMGLENAYVSGTNAEDSSFKVEDRVASNLILYDRASIQLYAGDKAVGTKISGCSDYFYENQDPAGQVQTMKNYANQQGQLVGAGGSAVNTKIYSFGWEYINAGGSASGTTIYAGGSQLVLAAAGADNVRIGVASGTHVSSGGTQYVVSGGSAFGTKIYAGGEQHVFSQLYDYDNHEWLTQATATSTTISNGGAQHVSNGGKADNTGIRQGGVQHVSSGGSAANTTIMQGGKQTVYSLGSAEATNLLSGGILNVSSGASATGIIQVDGGIINVSVISGDANTLVRGYLDFNGSHNFSMGNGTASGFYLYSGARMLVSSGATVTDTTVSSGGKLDMKQGAAATGLHISSGGVFDIIGMGKNTSWKSNISGTNADGTSFRLVSEEGIAENFVIYSGGRLALSDNAIGGMSAVSTTLSGGSLEIGKYVSAFDTSVTNGGKIVISGANIYAENTNVANGTATIGGTHETTVTLENFKVGQDGKLELGYELGGTMTVGGNITVAGTMDVKSNALVSFAEGTSITLDVSDLAPDSSGYMVTGLASLPENVSWTIFISQEKAAGTYRLVQGVSPDLADISVTVDNGSQTYAATLNQGCWTDGGKYYQLVADGGLSVSVTETDPLAVKPDALSFAASDASLNTAVSKALASDVTITDARFVNGKYSTGYGTFTVSNGNLVFTQTKAYSHASGKDSATESYSFAATDAEERSTTQDVTVTIADDTPTLTVSNITAPSGKTTAGTWTHSFGADVPATKSVTVGGKSLNMGTSTNSVAVAGTYGTLTVKADGSYSYAAKADAIVGAGTVKDTFAFKIADSDGDSVSKTLTVTVKDGVKPTVTKITGRTNAIGATMQFSEAMSATTLKSALKAIFTGTGATVAPTAIKETNVTSHVYSATFAATNYVGAYKLTLGTGAKDLAGNAITMMKTVNVNMTVTSKTIAAGAYQKIYSGGAASASKVSGQQLVYSGGRAVNSVISKGGKLVLYSGGTATGATIAASATATAASGATITGAKVAGALTAAGAVKTATIQKGGKLYLKGGAVATGNTIASGATAVVSSGATAATFSGGSLAGTLTVSSTGVVKAAAVKAGGKLTLKAGAKATGVKIAGTSAVAGTMTVAGTATTTTVQAYGALTVNGGAATTVSVAKNGSLTLTKGTVKTLTLAAGGKAQLNGGSLTGTTTLNGGVTTVAAAGVKVAKISAQTSAVVSYDISKQKAGGTTAMLVESTKQALNTGYRIVTAKAQQMGVYKLSSKLTVAAGKAFAIYQGTTKLGTATLGTAKKLNGVSYTVSQASNVVSLKLAVAAGKMLKGTTGADTLTGTAHSDIFWGGKGNDIITGSNGRDVAVYDGTAWGKDTIKATSGTMTIVLAGIAKSKVTETTSGTTKTFTLTGTSQKITVQGWNAATHKILYNQTLSSFNTYVKAASPTTAQTTKARSEVWQKAGLASA